MHVEKEKQSVFMFPILITQVLTIVLYIDGGKNSELSLSMVLYLILLYFCFPFDYRLCRVVKEIESVNKKLIACGLGD